MTYDNIKRHIKPGFHRLFGRYIFRKITNEARGLKGGGGGGKGRVRVFRVKLGSLNFENIS